MSAAVAQAALEDAISLGSVALLGVALVHEGSATVSLFNHRAAQLRDSFMRGCLVLACGCEFSAMAGPPSALFEGDIG